MILEFSDVCSIGTALTRNLKWEAENVKKPEHTLEKRFGMVKSDISYCSYVTLTV
jgi:hypothetical protein